MVLWRAALFGWCRLQASPFTGILCSVHGHTMCAMASMEGFPQQVNLPSVDQHIISLCNHKHLEEALSYLNEHMGNIGFSTFVCLIQSCSAMNALPEAKYLHFHMIDGGFDHDHFLANMIMRMYDKCGSLLDARALFESMPLRNIVSWNMIIGAYSSRGLKKPSFCLLCDMLRDCKVKPDKVTCITILTVCKNPLTSTDIKLLYGLILELEVEADVTVGNVLINAYGQWGTLRDAFSVFDRMPTKNVVSWNTLIAVCAIPGHEKFSLSLFKKMHVHNVARDKATFVSTLNACQDRSSLLHGMLVHFEIVEDSLETDIVVATTLVKMYGKCGSLTDGFRVFESMLPKRDIFCWTIMVASFIQQGHNKRGFQLFQEMLQERIKPNNVTFIVLLSACNNPRALSDGKMIRSCIVDTDINSDIILGNALLTMYQKCGSFLEVEELFYKMPKKDVVSYTAMIAAYAEQSRGYEALFLFERMGRLGIKSDRFIFSSVLDACASIAALIEGQLLYHVIIESCLEWDGVIGNALVSLYGECGVVEDAYDVFLKLSEQDWVAWSAMIGAYGNHGHSKEAFKLFWEMQQQGLQPTIITFVSVFSACSHAGLLEEGQEYFLSMTRDHAATPTSEHYICMIDLISRAGCCCDAKQFIDRMPLQPNALLWNTLLGACRVHGIVEGGHLAAKYVFEMNPQCDSAYVALSNLYASAGRFEEALSVRKAWEAFE